MAAQRQPDDNDRDGAGRKAAVSEAFDSDVKLLGRFGDGGAPQGRQANQMSSRVEDAASDSGPVRPRALWSRLPSR